MAYRDFKDLTRRTAANNVLRDKAFNIAQNLKYDGHQQLKMVEQLKMKLYLIRN